MFVFHRRYIHSFFIATLIACLLLVGYNYRYNAYGTGRNHSFNIAHSVNGISTNQAKRIGIPRTNPVKTRYIGGGFDHNLNTEISLPPYKAGREKKVSSSYVSHYSCFQHAFYLRGPPLV